jgi:hypothetical protein
MRTVGAAGTAYGRPRAWHRLYIAITSENCGLRDQLRALHQAAHQGADPADVDAVQSALFAAFGGGR